MRKRKSKCEWCAKVHYRVRSNGVPRRFCSDVCRSAAKVVFLDDPIGGFQDEYPLRPSK